MARKNRHDDDDDASSSSSSSSNSSSSKDDINNNNINNDDNNDKDMKNTDSRGSSDTSSSSDEEETEQKTTKARQGDDDDGGGEVEESESDDDDDDNMDDGEERENEQPEEEDDDDVDEEEEDVVRTTLSKSWTIASSHVPTYTGGKVAHSKSNKKKSRQTPSSSSSLEEEQENEDSAYHTTTTATTTTPFLLMLVHGDLAIVDSEHGTKVGTLRGDDALVDDDDEDEGVDHDAITAFALDGNDQTIITCSRNNLLRSYSINPDTLKTKLLKTWGRSGHTLPVAHMEFHSSSVFLATGSVDGTVRIWDTRGGFVTHVFRPYAGGDGGGSGRLGVTAVSWRQEVGKLVVAIGRDDGSMTIHDLRDSANDKNEDRVIILRDHDSPVTCMDWWEGSGGQQFFVSTGRDQILNLWRIVREHPTHQEGKKKKKEKSKHPDSIQESYKRIKSLPVYEQVEGMILIPSTNPNELLVVTAGSKGAIRLWKANIVPNQTPELSLAMEQPQDQQFGDASGGYMGLYLNQHALANADENGKELMIAVDAEHNLSFLSSKLAIDRTIVGHNDEILDLKTITGTDSIVVATNSPQVRIFQLGNYSCEILDGHTATVLCVVASPCGRLVATCGKDKILRIWNVESRKCVGIAIGHTEAIGACGLSQKLGRYDVEGRAAKNGGGAFCVTGSIDRTLKRWNLRGTHEFACVEEPIELVASAGVRAHDKDINIISVSPNDSLVATGSQDKTVKLWNATDLSLKATIKGHRRGVWDCQFSPIDRILATSSGDKTIKLWSLGDYSCVRTFQGHLASVLRVRFLKTGLQLVSSGADGLIKLWTIRTNECETTLDAHTDKVWALDLDSDGRKIVSGGADSKLNVWEDNTQQVEETTRVKEAESILLEQKLSNYLRIGEHGKALTIALQIEKPLQALKVFTAIVEQDLKKSKSGLEALQSHARTWKLERIAQVLRYCRDWNTRARNATISMLVVKAIVTTIPVDKLASADVIPEILAGIIPYAERHFERLDQMHSNTYLLDYTLQSMGVVEPVLMEESSETRFDKWQAKSKLVLPPKYVDGRIQIGGKAIIGKDDMVDDSSESDSDDEVVSIGESSTDSDSS